MRTMAAIILLVASGSLLAADSTAPEPFRLPPLFEGWTPKDFQSLKNQADARKRMAPRRGCYFIRQVNRNLTRPLDRPRLIKLAADATDTVYAPDPDCLPGTIIRNAVRE